ncbi:MAG: class I SAM-dependent methyltransferase [Candidatus Latescibacteria bacterium]|nr:class I SAM-dependent methyltransferase [Candidatus Latescibacterota bacterium]
MDKKDRKKHWEKIFEMKKPNEVSWYQEIPETSLTFLNSFNLPKTAKIIDIGGGDSFFVDNLIELGYQNITVLDISEKALEKARTRLGGKAEKITWITSDVTEFQPDTQYDFWHDRVTFHFLTDEDDIEKYITIMKSSLNSEGYLVIGTFSENGPKKCSGLEIKQYSEMSMSARLENYFKKLKCITVDHRTPFDTIQNFLFCSFKRLNLISI